MEVRRVFAIERTPPLDAVFYSGYRVKTKLRVKKYIGERQREKRIFSAVIPVTVQKTPARFLPGRPQKVV
jgi:hypothetical protein